MNPKFFMSRSFLGTAAAIIATGLILNLANKGKLGESAKKLANNVTSGYGAGPIAS